MPDVSVEFKIEGDSASLGRATAAGTLKARMRARGPHAAHAADRQLAAPKPSARRLFSHSRWPAASALRPSATGKCALPHPGAGRAVRRERHRNRSLNCTCRRSTRRAWTPAASRCSPAPPPAPRRSAGTRLQPASDDCRLVRGGVRPAPSRVAGCGHEQVPHRQLAHRAAPVPPPKSICDCGISARRAAALIASSSIQRSVDE